MVSHRHRLLNTKPHDNTGWAPEIHSLGVRICQQDNPSRILQRTVWGQAISDSSQPEVDAKAGKMP